MNLAIITKLLSRGPKVVATIHSSRGLTLAQHLPSRAVDFLEIRVDSLSEKPQILLKRLAALRVPLIITVRDFREGGSIRLAFRERQFLFETYLPLATMIDLELRSIRSFRSLIERAHKNGVGVIVSSHDFKTTPSTERLRTLSEQAKRAGADLLKVAATTSMTGQLARLLEFVGKVKGLPVSAMGMGKFGKISRLALACAGSRLNYGFLDRPNADGQWPAQLLKERIDELMG